MLRLHRQLHGELRILYLKKYSTINNIGSTYGTRSPLSPNRTAASAGASASHASWRPRRCRRWARTPPGALFCSATAMRATNLGLSPPLFHPASTSVTSIANAGQPASTASSSGVRASRSSSLKRVLSVHLSFIQPFTIIKYEHIHTVLILYTRLCVYNLLLWDYE